MIHTYNVIGLTCQSCVEKVSKAIKELDEVQNIEIDLKKSKATITMNHHLNLDTLNQALKPLKKYKLQEQESESLDSPNVEKEENLTPLIIIVGYLSGAVLLRAIIAEDFSLHTIMTNFMGGFFIIFSLFKMIDLKGFAEGYATYDIIAGKSEFYAKTYPFLELILGVLYFTDLIPTITNVITAILMFIGSLGVAKALVEKRTIQCACLGTALKLPMTKVTLVEDISMGIMAIIMLVI